MERIPWLVTISYRLFATGATRLLASSTRPSTLALPRPSRVVASSVRAARLGAQGLIIIITLAAASRAQSREYRCRVTTVLPLTTHPACDLLINRRPKLQTVAQTSVHCGSRLAVATMRFSNSAFGFAEPLISILCLTEYVFRWCCLQNQLTKQTVSS